MSGRSGRNPGRAYNGLTDKVGKPCSTRVEAKADARQKAALSKLAPEQVKSTELAGEPIVQVLSHAPGNGPAIGGLKAMTANGWFAARPPGTEYLYKIYAESFIDEPHLPRLVQDVHFLVDASIA